MLGAGVRVLKKHYLDSSRARSPLPITVSEVLRELRSSPAPGEEPIELTTGAVAAAFGSKVGFLERIAEELISPSEVVGGLLSSASQLRDLLGDPDQVRRALVLGDLDNTSGTVATTRHWFGAHSQAANPAIADQLRQVYEGVDEALVPLYAAIGEAEGRRPREGFEWQHISAAMTAWLEGFAMRHHYLPDGQKEAPWQTASDAANFLVTGADGLWRSLTEPDPARLPQQRRLRT